MRKLDELLREFLGQHENIIVNALETHLRNMREAAGETQAGFDAVKDDPQARAAQDKTMITTSGLEQMAQMFRESADKDQAALDALEELSERMSEL